ncbi:hypothetical protein BH20ACT24_BH20ACT24_07300 [soil metagenome]
MTALAVTAGSAVVAALVAALLLPRARRPVATNHRGVRLPVVLGIALVAGVVLAALARVLAEAALGGGPAGEVLPVGWLLAATALVSAGGLYDDLQPDRTRGLINQLSRGLHGEITPGLVKLVAIVVAAAIAVAALGGGPARLMLGVPFVAGSANLWNLLDVAPGRAIKYQLLAAFAVLPLAGNAAEGLLPAATGAAAGVAAFDLRERGMLGDSGSNVLGFVLGATLYPSLPVWGLALALAIVLAIHGVAESITLSRVIARTPPLRWLDELGRIRC